MPEKNSQATKDSELEARLKKLEESNDKLQEENRGYKSQLTKSNNELLQVLQKRQDAPPKKTNQEPDFDKDPKAWKEWKEKDSEEKMANFKKDMEGSEEKILKKIDDKMSKKEKNSILMGKFKEKYPELAEKNMDLVEFVGAKLVKGKDDPDKYMYGDMDKFVADVGTEAQKVLGIKPGDKDNKRSSSVSDGQLSFTQHKKGDEEREKVDSFMEQHKAIRTETYPITPFSPVTTEKK